MAYRNPLHLALLLAALSVPAARAQAEMPTRAATENPADVAPTPTRTFTPPLSLFDCQQHLDNLIDEIAAGPLDAGARAHADRLLREVTRYLRDRDNVHSTLNTYTWELLTRGKVAGEEFDLDVFVFDPPRRRISVLSFEAEGADIHIETVRVFDEHDNLVDAFRPDEESDWTVQTVLPRRETLHFWRRTTIARIEVTYRQLRRTSSLPVRLYIYGAISETREYAKMAVFQMERARGLLREDQPEAALELLREARENIASYRARRNTRRN